MINVCFFSGGMNRSGGTEHMTQMLANELSKDIRYHVFVLSTSDDNMQTFYPLNSNITYAALDNSEYKKIYSVIKDVFLLRKYIKQNHIDILINVDIMLGIFSLPLVLLYPAVKLIYWDHFSIKFSYTPKMEKLRRLALRFGDAYVVLTEEDVEELRDRYPVRKTLLCINNMCAYPILPHPYDVDSKTIVSVGHLSQVKGFDIALEAAAIVLKKHTDWEWKFYGSGEEEGSLRRKAESLGIKDQVHFMGTVRDLSLAYREAALYVMSSRTEGFGLTLVEARAHHLPTIAFDVPYGPRNIIQHEVNGYLIEPFSVEKMASCINTLIEDDKKRLSFAEAASCGLEMYSAGVVADAWKRLFDTLD